MLNHLKLDRVLFLDIETVPMVADYEFLNPRFKKLWDRKSRHLVKKEQTPKDVFPSAGIYAEFGKIICISAGYLVKTDGKEQFRLTSFYGDDEKKLLKKFLDTVEQKFKSPDWLLCAHNGKEFDYPYISRRALVNGLHLPKVFDIAGKKPWDVRHLDTLDLWKFGDYKHYTSLDLLTAIFDIPTPKDDISGADVYRVYYQNNDLERIVKYCEKDVLTVAQLLRKYKGLDLLVDENIIVV